MRIFIVLMIVFFIAHYPLTEKNFIYPFPYREKVEQHAAEYRVDKYLAVSVMKVESNFTEGAISRSGAVGLMQIMPETAEWIAYRLEEEKPTISDLHESGRNIKYGIWYLSDLEKEFYENDILALAAYNAGRGNVRKWMEQKEWGKNFSDIEAIPYLETRQYVKKVLACREKYNELYGEKEEQKLFVSR